MPEILKSLRTLRWLLALLSFGFQAARANGGQDPWADALETDRPDLADSAGTVGAERFQLESGLQRSADDSASALSLPLLLRVGLGERFEARVSTDGPQLAGDGTWTGFQDLGLGAKWTFLKNSEGQTLDAFGLIGDATLQDQGAGLALSDYSLALAADLNLPGDTGLGVNWVLTQEDPSGANLRDWSWAASFGFPLSQRWAGYLENSGVLPGAGDTTVGFDGGLKFLVTPDLQLDASFGDFFTGSTSQTTLALGCSFRFGNGSNAGPADEKSDIKKEK